MEREEEGEPRSPPELPESFPIWRLYGKDGREKNSVSTPHPWTSDRSTGPQKESCGQKKGRPQSSLEGREGLLWE